MFGLNWLSGFREDWKITEDDDDRQPWQMQSYHKNSHENANSAIFQLYHGENKLIFNEMMMRSALY